ncbi:MULTISPECIES: N-6 DNA methylase [unclassified Rhodanobacter]|uniref:N-6 DNA methylase n=1 Tax=unclassified Rhodanobacter TaxID=2621553 RepID=UPI001BE0B76F|nr:MULTISPECIES: N-6 DNA methylase [unclassified Rhodanobacter]MBT2144896.1 N-6 DNA methylase [Rhodanobacter sp. LX-99]MBT2148941.1 N-6 DNA methylase [Rhodanobacter sp. LX-100]
MKNQPSHDKLRGGYYTPQPIAHYLAEWAIRSKADTVLEPSCGDGNILIEAAKRLRSLRSTTTLTGVELFDEEAKKARARLKDVTGNVKTKVLHSSFFDHAEKAFADGTRYDVIIGNPPFVRYQDFPEEQRQQAFGLMRRIGLNPSRLSNAWLPFLAISAALLTEHGRLALVIPAELFQVGYAAEVRQYLAEYFPQINIVAFERLVFPDIQQEIVLILADRAVTRQRGIRVHEVENASMLSDIDLGRLAKRPIKPVDHASEKWTKYFLDKSEILLLRELRERTDVPQLRNFIDIDVGVVTGDNDYFLLDAEDRSVRKLDESTIPIVGRSAALAGIVFEENDFDAWVELGKKAHMFLPTPPHGAAVKRYIKHGEEKGVNTGYKCGIRKEWYVVPSVWTPDVFFLRQADHCPRLVANRTRAICTDTLHRGRLVDGVAADVLAAAFNNSLTFAASEVTGRSYGGGVMTFEPSEVEKLPLPMAGIEAVNVRIIDRLIRNKETAAALDLVDRATLMDGMGLNQRQVTALRGIWMKLKERRRGRKK